MKQQTIDNRKSKQQKVNQYIQKLNAIIESLETDLKNSKANNFKKNNESAGELEEGLTTKSEDTELEKKIKELEQINSSLKDNNNKTNKTLNIKTNKLARTLEDLKSQKEKSDSGKKDFFRTNIKC